ncbi:MAG TPA: CAP domain-containing protein, partial [Pyrinomonadaceae bacterium]|nr:CAP domain-containing protein [Pyrinomonadaceae bacterium]
MKFYNSFPQTLVYRHARLALLLPCLLFISGLVNNSHAQTKQTRPVARLIASSGHAIQPPVARPRTVSVARASSSESAHAPLSINATTDERRVFELINQARRAQGYAPLVWDAELTRMAREHSAEMAGQNFLSHEGPDGGMVERARERGIRGWQVLAENIAYNQGFDDPAG